MRIIVLNDHADIVGGAAQVAISSLNSFADAGFDVTFVSAVGPVSSLVDQERVRVVCFEQFDLVGNPSLLDAAINGVWNSHASRKLGELLSEYDSNDTIIHLHTWVKSLSSSVIYEIYSRRFKLVCTLHDYFTVCPNGGFYNYQMKKHCNLAPMSLSCFFSHCDSRSYVQKIWRFSRHLVQHKIAGMPDDIDNYISISNYSEQILRRFLPMRANIFRIKNPIMVDRFPPSQPSDSNVFSFIGRFSPEKGGVLFAKAARNLNAVTQFVGSGVEESSIRNILPNANFLGWQDRNGVLKALKSSRVLVFPSLWHETQGLIVLEAAALGIPAIVSEDCAAKDGVVDGVTGLMFKTGCVDDLSRKLQLFLDNPEMADSMGLNAYENYWSNPCTLANHVQELVNCYKKILTI
jgi:glycosyltransferase involved in cell wall biosynthesis